MQLTYYPVLKPIRKDIAEKYGDKYGTEADTVVSNGPFVLKEWVHRAKMVYEKNPHYWDKDHVYIEKINGTIMEEDSAYYQALYKGNLDSGGVGKPEWMDRLEKTGDFKVIKKPGAAVDFFMFNANNKYFKNTKIRRAFSAAYDRSEYVEEVTNGIDAPAHSYMPPTFSIGDENYSEKVDGNDFVKKLVEDIEDPKALLIEGLKEIGEDPDPAKMDVSILFRGTTEKTKQEAEWFKQSIDKTLGTDIKLDLLKWNIAFDRVDNNEFDIYYGGWFGDYNDPSTMLEFWHSKTGYYKIGWHNEEFNSLLIKAATTTDQDKRAEYFKRAEEILVYEDAIVSPFRHTRSNTFRRNYVKELANPLFGYTDYKHVYTLGRE